MIMQQIANAHMDSMLMRMLLWIDSHFIVLVVSVTACFLMYMIVGLRKGNR